MPFSKEKISSALFKGIFKFLSYLPLSLLRFFGRTIGSIVWLSNTRMKTRTRNNIKRCYPKLSEKELNHLSKESLQETVTLMLELSPTWLWEVEKCEALIENVFNPEILENAYNKQQGTIIVLPHLGNWEITGAYLGTRYPITAMYKPPKQKEFEEFVLKSRERYNATMAPTNARGILQLVKALKRGEVVIILPDQVPETSNAINAPFMQQDCLTMLLIYKLLQKTPAQVIASAAIRTDKGFNLHFLNADDDIYSDDAYTSASSLNNLVEKCIELAPAQYQWEYNRFKKNKK